jgi:hypothetical protein
MAECWIARPGRSGAFVFAGLALLMGLAGSLTIAQELSWPPSTADGAPHIDHTRKVLNCGSERCRLTVVRSQEELLSAVRSTVVMSPVAVPPRVPTLRAVMSGASDELQAVSGQRTQNAQQKLRVSFGTILILGGCFGGELPWRAEGDEPEGIPPEMTERFKAIEGRLPAGPPHLNEQRVTGSSPRFITYPMSDNGYYVKYIETPVESGPYINNCAVCPQKLGPSTPP